MYMEAAMFPDLFPVSVDGAPLGAFPLFMFMSPFSNQKRTGGLANILAHIPLRIGNPSHPTAQNEDYLAYLFCLKINADLNFHPLRLLLSRGPEALTSLRRPGGVSVSSSSDHAAQFRESTMDRPVRELSRMMQAYGPWTYFVTLTCNDTYTPGVSAFINLLKARYAGDPEGFAKAYKAYQPAILRLWQRNACLMLDWISSSPEKPFGNVKHFFGRWEFQSGSGAGNKPHMHIGLTCEPDDNEYLTNHRVVCREGDMIREEQGNLGDKDFVMGTFPNDLIRHGYVRDHLEWEQMMEFYRETHVSIINLRWFVNSVGDYVSLVSLIMIGKFENIFHPFRGTIVGEQVHAVWCTTQLQKPTGAECHDVPILAGIASWQRTNYIPKRTSYIGRKRTSPRP